MNRVSDIIRYLVIAVILATIVALLVVMTYSGSIKMSYHWTKSPSQASVEPVTEEHVRSLLARVLDSELGVNIVELGLVYEIGLPSPGAVDVTMTLTTPHCPYGGTIIDDIQKNLMADQSINDARLRIVFEPAWSWSRVDKGVRERIIKQFSSAPPLAGHNHD